MEAAIRWSTNPNNEGQRFLIADVAEKRLRYCEVKSITDNHVKYKQLSQREKLPNFTAFDWYRNDESLVAIGTSWGESRVVNIDSSNNSADIVHSFPNKLQRKCNSICFSSKGLLASGLDKVRNDSSLNIYDIRTTQPNQQAFRRLANSELVSSVKFFADEPDLLLASISKQSIRLYDLRDSGASGAASIGSRNCQFLAVNATDGNIFASGGEHTICVWDRRFLYRSSTPSPSSPTSTGALLEISPSIDTSRQATTWSLRPSPRRGCFAALSSVGQIRLFEVSSFPNGRQEDSGVSTETSSPTYFTKRSHDLEAPWFHEKSSREEIERAIAFEFMSSNSVKGDGLITIRQNKTLEVVRIPSSPAIVRTSSVNDLYISNGDIPEMTPAETVGTIAEDLARLQQKLLASLTIKPSSSDDISNSAESNNDATRTLNLRSRFNGELARQSSRERHEDAMQFWLPRVMLTQNEGLLLSDVARRRCREGYLFDCAKNKEIVKNDSWLLDMWDVIERIHVMTKGDGMCFDSLDLSYLGVFHIWNAKLGPNKNRIVQRMSKSVPDFETAVKTILSRHGFSEFEGAKTQYPDYRQLGLAICGWRFDVKRLKEKTMEILERGEPYKAIVVAVLHNRKDVAIELLKTAIKTRLLDNAGLAAVIACETVSDEQRDLCAWMAEDATDAYLKALLTYFITGEWSEVVAMAELPLLYRVAVALKWMDDAKLSQFLSEAMAEAIAEGDTEGIVLTGLAEPAIDLFQNYIAKSNDLQTAVLATAFTNPRYVDDVRWHAWKETYFLQMQMWHTFIERTRFTVLHNRMSVSRDGQRLVHPAPRQVTLRCNHCQKAIGYDAPESTVSDDDASSTTASQATRNRRANGNQGTSCPWCGRHMPRCSICMLWLGTPDTTLPNNGAGHEEDKMARFINFCMSCNHGFHAHHARDWFAKHQVCPVPDCDCLCALRR